VVNVVGDFVFTCSFALNDFFTSFLAWRSGFHTYGKTIRGCYCPFFSDIFVIEISVIDRKPDPHGLVLNFVATRGMVDIAGIQ